MRAFATNIARSVQSKKLPLPGEIKAFTLHLNDMNKKELQSNLLRVCTHIVRNFHRKKNKPEEVKALFQVLEPVLEKSRNPLEVAELAEVASLLEFNDEEFWN